MSLGETLKKFFTERKKDDQREEDEIIKSLALAACEGKHKVLIECYKASWVGGCQKEMDSFWKCVNDNKAILKRKAQSYKINNNENNSQQAEFSEDS